MHSLTLLAPQPTQTYSLTFSLRVAGFKQSDVDKETNPSFSVALVRAAKSRITTTTTTTTSSSSSTTTTSLSTTTTTAATNETAGNKTAVLNRSADVDTEEKSTVLFDISKYGKTFEQDSYNYIK
jgi:mevalonate pyrophosphate decarboxylase